MDAIQSETVIVEDDKEEEEEDTERTRDNLGSRVKFLEKTMAKKHKEMRKIQNQMADLGTEVSSQIEGMMNNINTFVQNMEHELSTKATTAAAQVNKPPECFIG